MTSAEIIFVNGEVVTVNASDDILQAVAVQQNRIVAVGTNYEVLQFRGPKTRVVDLKGKTLMPGIIDAHVHMLIYGTNKLGVDCKNGVRSIEDIVGRLHQRAALTPSGEWIRGWGYNDAKLLEKRHPTRWDLDRVSTTHPIIVVRTCAHISAVNSKALEVLGITRHTPDPDGGRIERDERGEPTGVLKETAHMAAFEVAKYSRKEILTALQMADEDFVRNGITSIHEAGGYGPDQLRIIYEAVRDRLVRVRVYAMLGSLNRSEDVVEKMIQAGLITGIGDERFRLGPAKIFLDGSSSGPTCATRQPYTSNRMDYGILYFSQEQVDEILGAAHRLGFQITAHAVGDRAVEMMINCVEKALAHHPRSNHRHRIEHAGMVPPDLLKRMKAIGVIPVANPAFFFEFGEGYQVNYGDRVKYMFPMADYVREGMVAATGSDSPITAVDPMRGLYCAVTRLTENGSAIGPEQRVSRLQAVRAFTWSGAYASFEETTKGSLEPGKRADLVVLNGSLMTCHESEILSLSPVMTMIDGQIAYEGDLE